MVIEFDAIVILCGVENPNSLQGELSIDRITWCEYRKAPTRQLHGNTRCFFWSGHIRKHNTLALSSISKKVGTRCRSPSYEWFFEGCSSPFMRLADHLTALRAWCKQCPPGW